MKRGDILIVAPLPPFHKPRPGLVVQATMLGEIENVTVALITSDLAWSPGVRVTVEPTAENGLRRLSQVMIDLLVTVPLGRVGGYAGSLEPGVMSQVDAGLRLFLGL